MDPRIVSTDKLVKILFSILDVEGCISTENFGLIIKKIYDSCIGAIRIFNTSSEITYPIEILNVLLLLSHLKDISSSKNGYKLDSSFIEANFLNKGGDDGCIARPLRYFSWASLVLYARDDPEYSVLVESINDKAIKSFLENKDKFESTEFFLFWTDFMACPYVKIDLKYKLISEVLPQIETDIDRQSYLDEICPLNKGIIIDWNNSNWLQNNLQKRVYKYAYE